MTAVQLSNVSLARGNGGAKTPHEMWTGNKPEVQQLKTWGCVTYTKALKPDDKKWDARANRCMFVGYTQSTKIGKFYDPVKKRSFTSRDVVFYEEESYYKDPDGGEKKETEMMDQVNWPTRIEPIEETSHPEEEKRKEPTEESSRGQRREMTREPAREETQPDSTLSSIPSDAELSEVRIGPVTPTGEPGYTHAEEHTPRVQQALDEFRRRVDEQVQWTLRGLQSDLGPAWEPPTTKRRRRTEGEFSGVAAVKFVDYVNMTTNGPSTLKEAVRSEERTLWEAAIREEIANLEAHGTWELVEPAQVAKGHIPITTRMMLVKKHDGNGKLTRYKGRLVGHGFKQRPGVDFDETYAPLVSLAAVRVALSYAAAMDLEIRQLYVIGAFLESKIDETLYISFPKGLVCEGNKIILDLGEFVNSSREPAIGKLIRSRYGTRQAAVNWYKCFDEILIRLGFTRSSAEAGIYMRGRLILLIWVDDILAIGTKKDVDEIARELKKELNIKDMGELKEGTFLGMTVRRKRGEKRIYLGQRGYINKILEKFGMDKANGVSTPIENGVKFNKRETDEEKTDKTAVPGAHRQRQLCGGGDTRRHCIHRGPLGTIRIGPVRIAPARN